MNIFFIAMLSNDILIIENLVYYKENIMKPKIIVKNLSKSFGSKKVLSDISFDIQNGEFLSVLGPSGCGKTTLMRILIGLEVPNSGNIYKDGEDITKLSPANRKMGIVFQNYALFENMSVLQNVSYALTHNKELKKNYTKEQARQVALKTLTDVGLSEHINKKPSALSGGQQQRVAIARTLAMNPEIILFDEPMSALDVETRLTLRSELKEIQKKFETTMFYITHDQEEAFSMSDRIMVMDKGVIHQIDTPQSIIDNPADEYIKDFVIRNLKIKVDSLVKYVK